MTLRLEWTRWTSSLQTLQVLARTLITTQNLPMDNVINFRPTSLQTIIYNSENHYRLSYPTNTDHPHPQCPFRIGRMRGRIQMLQSGAYDSVSLQSNLSQAAMQESTKEQVLSQNLYEVPTCTICLQELVHNLGNLDCGHVFHLECITQNFDYRAACPNCQKRAYEKEVRPIHFPLTLNNTANEQLRAILASLGQSEKKQVEMLLNEVKNTSEINQKLRNSINQDCKELKAKNAELQTLRQELKREKSELEKVRKELIKKDADWKGLSQELNQKERTEIGLRIQLQKLKKDEKDLQTMKKYKKLSAQNSSDIVKYREELQIKNTPVPEVLNIFFDMLLMQNLELLKIKLRAKEQPNIIMDKDYEISTLKKTIDALRKEAKEANDKKAADRKKYEALKAKFRLLSEKARTRGMRENDIPEMEESQGFNINKNFHLPEDPVVMGALAVKKKPGFNSSAMIGGLGRKKDDRAKIFN